MFIGFDAAVADEDGAEIGGSGVIEPVAPVDEGSLLKGEPGVRGGEGAVVAAVGAFALSVYLSPSIVAVETPMEL